MRRLFAMFLSAVILIFSCALHVNARALDFSKISAKGAILMDAQTGRILYEKNSNQVLQMASTTKIMTTLLCLESGNLDEYFTVDSNAIKVEGSSMGLVEGDRVTKRILSYNFV